MGTPKIDLSGAVVGKLKVLNYVSDSKRWACLCECGNSAFVRGSHLRTGKTRSCGCYKQQLLANGIGKKHGMHLSRTYKSWDSMLERCLNPKNKSYADYAGRGISVCQRWLKFENFLEDMGERPPCMSLDRINNDGNYEPGNCRWATATEQLNNTRANRFYDLDGKMMTARQLSDLSGINYHTLRERLRRGWSVKRAIGETCPSTQPA